MRTYNFSLGRIEPTLDKIDQNMVYNFSKLNIPTAETVEVELPLLSTLIFPYRQTEGSCTGASATWMTSTNNYPEDGIVEYDFRWLYRTGQDDDGDPRTGYDEKGKYHEGGQVWAVMDVLRKKGHRRIVNNITMPVNINDGIDSYYWCQDVDQLRTVFSLIKKQKSPARGAVFGTIWPKSFMEFDYIDGEPRVKNFHWWTRILGGHAYFIRACSDKRQAVLIRNSWGPYWGNEYGEAWLPYEYIPRLIRANGEISVAIDKTKLEV